MSMPRLHHPLHLANDTLHPLYELLRRLVLLRLLDLGTLFRAPLHTEERTSSRGAILFSNSVITLDGLTYGVVVTVSISLQSGPNPLSLLVGLHLEHGARGCMSFCEVDVKAFLCRPPGQWQLHGHCSKSVNAPVWGMVRHMARRQAGES